MTKKIQKEKHLVQHFGILNALGMIGWEHLEAPILTSLITEKPLLLIGEHGTGKSMFLERLAQALELNFKHYNASILNFDDLIGFPAPHSNGTHIQYLRSELDAWDAEIIFIDEISRCRPDLQNRLFPLIYDRKLQGKALNKLKYRWSAMNPIPNDDDLMQLEYIGSFDLDIAFADRYDWILPVPQDLHPNDRLKIIQGTAIQDNAGDIIQNALTQIQGRLKLTETIYGEIIATFFNALYPLLKRKKLEISHRRLRMLYENALVMIATNYYADISTALYKTVLYGLPQRVHQKIDPAIIASLIQMALKIQEDAIDGIKRQLLEEQDPIKRIVLALPTKIDALVTATVLDAYASLPKENQLMLSSQLFPMIIEKYPSISGIVLSQLAADVGKIEGLSPRNLQIATNSLQYKIYQRLLACTSQLTKDDTVIEDCMWIAFENNIYKDPKDVNNYLNDCRKIRFAIQGIQWSSND